MAPAVSTTPEANRLEAEVLRGLLSLYQDEQQIYAQVLELSRRQGEALEQGASMQEIRGLLETKKNCLNTIRRLETTQADSKLAWERGRKSWSVGGRARLNSALTTVGRIIEEILACEERNDMTLIQLTRDL